jgi:hypothetical protein
LGDNPFYGVDHLSHERARQRAVTTQTIDNIINVITSSYGAGMNGMVVATRPKLDELITQLRTRSEILDKLKFNAVMPYAQGYVLKLSEKGLINTVLDILKSAGLKNDLRMITQGTFGFLKKDFNELFKIFIDVELLKLKNIKVQTVFLHPVLTDLALALDMKKVFETFRDHLKDYYGVKAGLCTKNFSRLVSKLNEWELDMPGIMTSFNKAGFLMNPTRQECEKSLQNYSGDVIAMNIMAGGFLKLNEAYEYIVSLPKIRNVVIGVSSMEHAKKTFELFSSAQ